MLNTCHILVEISFCMFLYMLIKKCKKFLHCNILSILIKYALLSIGFLLICLLKIQHSVCMSFRLDILQHEYHFFILTLIDFIDPPNLKSSFLEWAWWLCITFLFWEQFIFLIENLNYWHYLQCFTWIIVDCDDLVVNILTRY